MEVEIGEDSSDDDDEDDIESLPQDPETCLQMNHVYQEVIKEKIEEVELLIAQNKEEQKEITWELEGTKTAKAGDGRNLPANVFLGHFMKPYFKDKVTGVGPPSNEDAKEKAAQGIKSFEQLHSTKWKTGEKMLLQKSVVSDRLQRLLQPKLLKLSYWNQKLEKVKTETEKQILEKQIKDLEREIEAINQLPESDLIGNRFDEHDWDKISNIHFDGQRSSEELKKFWQNWEHPSINKKEWTEEEIEKLKQIAAKYNYVDWQTIAQELGTNRTPFQCLQKYQIYNKDLKRKEWTKHEDEMLLELVQEMRVGSHIPYKKIAYYMEGRDSAQLIYRWTKSVDPSLKKGPWTPEEDAMLMAAVKKYGEKDWYKIRTEVPGRSDAQCRGRYLKALHWDVKKGRWSLEEEEKLIELVQKHGLGHWSKIASELPHRTGSQCLSKWKIIIGSKRKRSRATKQCNSEESSSLSESSGEDMELDLTDCTEEEVTRTTRKECAIPSIDLWIPTGTDIQEVARERYQIQSLLSAARAGTGSSCGDIPGAGCDEDKAVDKSCELSTLLRGIAQPYSTDVLVKNAEEVIAKASQCGKEVLQVSLEDVRTILRNNTKFQRKLILKPPASLLAKPPGMVADAGQDVQELQELPRRIRYRYKEHWRRLSLDRKLLMAVTPWVGNVLLPCTLQAGRRKAAAIHNNKSVGLTSTPLFALLIQLFQIDTKGCMKIIKERRLRQLELHEANARSPQQASQNTETSSGNSSQACSQRNSQQGNPKGAVRRQPAVRPRDTPTDAWESCAPAGQGAPPAQWQRQKPKTVSQLLWEKRLKESQAKNIMQRTVLLAPQQRPASLLPALVTPQAASPGVPNSILPFRWVVTAQALFPCDVQAVVGVPQVMPAANGRNQFQTTVISNGNVCALGETPVPAGANLPHPSSAETKGPSSQLKGVPLGKAADQGTVLLPVASGSPGCTTSTISAVTPVRSGGSSMAPDSFAAPAASPVLCAVVLPQTQLPASTQGSGSQPVPSLTSLGRSSDSITTNRSSFNPDSIRKRAVPCPGAAAPHNNVPGSSGCSRAQALRNRPIASKPPSADVPPQPSTSNAEKNLLDFSLISLEDEGLVKEWLSGKQGVQVPSLQTRLPYLPPFLCSIKTLSKLLVQKAALEEQAASLLPSEASGDGSTGDVFHAIGELVQQKLGDNPAYLLLKARFLAAFTLPAVLATLPPPKVTTTLSAGVKQHEESDDEWQSEKEVSEEESCGKKLPGVREDWRLKDEPGDKNADLLNQGMRAEESPAQSALGSCTDEDDARAPQLRRSTRLRKRRRRI
ncbi:snRNA-activating protein complex subunit 4 [Cyanistes caeruleus]|uniref:Small nuclear RNA activating complex polypeptide 4 n=1 Tax=Cyanistes caeruleus TaxID=156563 RepID=A0A8C0UBC3_CYACU|nr:snRNA-activating protein complex subunit 4 [Cyanistes caeruleus]XP_023794073.1 snRNA-activating protein complex subunit 4 [Cyanistes caeruleus]